MAATATSDVLHEGVRAGPTVTDVIRVFKEHVESYYRKPDGRP